MKDAKRLFRKAHTLAQRALIAAARAHLRKLPDGAECVAAMGSLFFAHGSDAIDPPVRGPLARALADYESMFGCTYGPYRFTRAGPIVTDW
jgi:hypothetical protein